MMRSAGSMIAAILLAGMLPVAAEPRPDRVDRSLPWVTEDAGAPRVERRTFESRAATGPVSYHIYAPAAYDEPGTRLPVLYRLHGTVGGVSGIRLLAAHFDAEIRAGRMPPVLVVFVNGLPRRLWADSKNPHGGFPMSDSTTVDPKEETAAAPAEPAIGKPNPRPQIDVTDTKCVASYANFCRVTGTPEELIVDFGLNKNMNPEPGQAIEISQRIIVNFFTAKRLLAALHMAVQRHESAFGVLETDVRKRVVPAASRGTRA